MAQTDSTARDTHNAVRKYRPLPGVDADALKAKPMNITNYFEHRANAEQTTKDILELIDSRASGTWSNLLLTDVLSRLLKSTFSKPTGFHESAISASVANAAAAQIGPQISAWIGLHQWMIQKGYTQSNEWDLGSVDRYACALADEETFKSFMLRTQSQTYLIAIELCEGFEEGPEGETLKVQKLGVDIRMCQGPALQRSCHLGFMLSKATALRSPYFNIKDTRDEGYLVSVRPNILGSGWTAGSTAPDWQRLGYAIQEFNSLVVSSTLE